MLSLDPAWNDLTPEQRERALNSGPGPGFAASRISRHHGLQTNVPGALYGGGKAGLKTLLDSMAADRKRAGLPPLAGEDLERVETRTTGCASTPTSTTAS